MDVGLPNLQKRVCAKRVDNLTMWTSGNNDQVSVQVPSIYQFVTSQQHVQTCTVRVYRYESHQATCNHKHRTIITNKQLQTTQPLPISNQYHHIPHTTTITSTTTACQKILIALPSKSTIPSENKDPFPSQTADWLCAHHLQEHFPPPKVKLRELLTEELKALCDRVDEAQLTSSRCRWFFKVEKKGKTSCPKRCRAKLS